MQQLLYSYLIQNNSLTLPGIGTVYVRRKAAETDFINHRLLPPAVYFELDTGVQQVRNDLFNYIASHKNVDQAKAIQLLNEFSFNLTNDIKRDAYHWKGIGILTDSSGGFKLDAQKREFSFLQPVEAQRVVHEHAEHYITVGDKEKTNVQMSEWLQERGGTRKQNWQTMALLLVTITTLLLVLNYLKVVPSFISSKKEMPPVSVEIK
jgi:hypothetical protein